MQIWHKKRDLNGNLDLNMRLQISHIFNFNSTSNGRWIQWTIKRRGGIDYGKE